MHAAALADYCSVIEPVSAVVLPRGLMQIRQRASTRGSRREWPPSGW